VARDIPPSDRTPNPWQQHRPQTSGRQGDSRIAAPPRWPGAVCPPASADFEQSAKAWLFELAPARWWHEEILHRYPVELARMVRLRLEGDIMAMQAGLRAASRNVLGHEPARAGGAPQASELYMRESEWARAMLEQVKLVEEALRGACTRARRGRPTAAASSGRETRSAMQRQRPATGRTGRAG
jgi:hypothetical protein